MDSIQVVFRPGMPDRKVRLFMEALKTRIANYSELRSATTTHGFAELRTQRAVTVLVSVGFASDGTLRDLEDDLQRWRNRHFGGETIEVKREK